MLSLHSLLPVIADSEELKFLGMKLINTEDFISLIVRFSMNLLVILAIVIGLYAKNSRRKDFYFSFIAVSILIFLLCFLLANVKMEMGFALGLFAVFSIIRYRTDSIPIKEMTYLFVVIVVSVINALANKKISYAELIMTNVLIVGLLYVLEKILHLRQEIMYQVLYEKIENVQGGKEEELLADLKQRTGKNIKHYQVERIDFLRDVAYINIFFDLNGKNKLL
jgi:predicted nucleic-acid-binding protein